jgi:xanthine dehydrogenase iron-sulfur cluster and FAD-binding subunit A
VILHPVQTGRLAITNYEAPEGVEEALAILARHRGRARIVAGATDLLLELQRGIRPEIQVLIDLTRVPGLDRIELEGEEISLGPLVTHNQVIGSQLVVDRALPLAQACLEVGSPQLRNRATVVGNLVTASPANDTITPLRALGATLTLSSLTGEREIPLEEFHTGLRETVLRSDEMVTSVRFPALGPNQKGLFAKLGLRRAQAISVVHLAVIVDFDGATVRSASLALGSVAPTVVRASAAEQYLAGKPLTYQVMVEAARLAAEAVAPIDDIRATAGYRREEVGVMVFRTLQALVNGKERSHWPDDPVTLGAITSQPLTSSLDSKAPIEATVNGRRIVAPGISKTLLDWLRDDAGPAAEISLTGTKEGCAEGECGACTVVLDGAAVMACLVPAARAHGAEVVTIEGLAGGDGLHPLQQTFVDQGAVQCGFCIPGFLMAGVKLLEQKPDPTVEEMRLGLSGNLCRCTGYYKVMTAMEKARR